jgi:DnaJ-class molecular chaperone
MVVADKLTGAPDLSIEMKVKLLRLQRRLKTLSPHELLGVAPDADRETVKRAYLAAAKEIHPDRFYRKDVGLFRPILGEIFTHLSRASQVLLQAKAKK